MKISALLVFLLGCAHLSSAQSIPSSPNIGTYSICGWDSVTGDLGVAVQSKFLGVGAVVPYAKAGVGAIATQAFANTTFGPEGLRLLEQGLDPSQVLQRLLAVDTGAAFRQIGILNAQGSAAGYTGTGCQPYAGNLTGPGYAVQGNILAGESVVRAMAMTFESTTGDLAVRLLAALDAAEKAGGDKRGRQSAALLVVRQKGGYGGFNDRFIDLRVDDDSLPLVELRRIYHLWQETFLADARFRTIAQFDKDRKYLAAQVETARVIEMFNNQLRLKPDDPDLLNSIAWQLATHDLDHARALDLAQRASKLAPTNLNILDTVAECQYRLGHYDEAIAIELDLLRRDPSNQDFIKQLAKFKEAKGGQQK